MRHSAKLMCLMCFLCPSMVMASAAVRGPVHLPVDNLDRPLGIDDPEPRFSWQLNDPRRGAKQTAFRVSVATKAELLGKPDVWDSGKVGSGQSLNVKYAGPGLNASTRYFWRVEVWGSDGKAYPSSEGTWWETGLYPSYVNRGSGHNANPQWKGQWIGWETAEEAAERKAPAKWIASPEAKP